ncbi:hypothetical protein F4778DRAFT_10344 [Xylariomycetidae sp. FL2044]|nr:hypothetical protein F4778DRAFT_10344 [Xylariomycetidae sp. FL2044]
MASYQPLNKISEFFYTAEELHTDRDRQRRRRITYGIGLLLLTNLISLSWPFWMPLERPPSDLARTEELETVYKRLWWNTAYSPGNRSDADGLWDEINPAHGIVSVDRAWAAARGWPLTGYHPDDKTKAVYLLEAYHMLHCLRIMRLTFWEAMDGKPFTYQPGPHVDHCFDAMRQYVQCNADNTPLYSFGDHTAGDGQLHKCKNWDQLRVWAAERSACYRDSVEDIPFKDHFGFCREDGDDGVRAIDYGVPIL